MKFPFTEKSSLIPNEYQSSKRLRRLRPLAENAGYEIYEGYCEECGTRLTELDLQVGRCDQCSAALRSLNEGDGLIDEDGCDCEVHRLADNDRAARFKTAVELTCEEVIASGGTLPDYSEELGLKDDE